MQKKNKAKHVNSNQIYTISEGTYNKLRPVGSKLRTLYGSAKVHKLLKKGLVPLRPILSLIDRST